MVGLSIVLESQKGRIITTKTSPQVINKTTISKPSSSKIPTFLDQCFLCRSRLSPTKDIYMYRGDKAFCSEECRCKQIFMDEEESIQKENCSLAAMRPTSSSSSSASASSNANSHHQLHRKLPRNPTRGGFAYSYITLLL